MNLLRRARPLLGTLVEMRVEGLRERAAVAALDEAFAEVQQVHRCMSFHADDSDLARLHRTPPGRVVPVDARTAAVLAAAQTIAQVSQGVFDVSVGAALVRLGLLPRPGGTFEPDACADWRDIELRDGGVRLRRPLWIDLGGIAKGFAVDRAIEILIEHGATHAAVNAGGDLRLHGARRETVFLRVERGVAHLPHVQLTDAAIATSARNDDDEGAPRAHLHGRTREPLAGNASVSVVADCCLVADALTKVVLAAPPALAQHVLAVFDAEASLHDPVCGWQRLGRAA